jgi:hypothetical protein
MNKITMAWGVLAAASAVLLASHSADAQLRPSPQPILTLAPTFNCGVTVNGATGTAIITHSNAAAVDKTKDVVATIMTPSGKVSASVCGSVFSASSKAGAGFSVPATTDKSYIYTCSAVQTSQTLTCNPVR